MDEELLLEFVEERLNAWETKHGLLATDESRECMQALLFGCLNITPNQIKASMKQDHRNEQEGEDCSIHCFCERNLRL